MTNNIWYYLTKWCVSIWYKNTKWWITFGIIWPNSNTYLVLLYQMAIRIWYFFTKWKMDLVICHQMYHEAFGTIKPNVTRFRQYCTKCAFGYKNPNAFGFVCPNACCVWTTESRSVTMAVKMWDEKLLRVDKKKSNATFFFLTMAVQMCIWSNSHFWFRQKHFCIAWN